jgi:UDP:flavonoid glycosyltransferase YjiC (YdhE family)
VARRITEAGVGVGVPLKRLTPEALRTAVRRARALPAWPVEPAGAAPERFADAVAELLPAVRPSAAEPTGRDRRA